MLGFVSVSCIVSWILNFHIYVFFANSRVYLNIMYTFVEVMRSMESNDVDGIYQARQNFFSELSK